MDNGLVLATISVGKNGDVSVLILIVVDNGLVQNGSRTVVMNTIGLNPYCSGQWSRTLLNAVKGTKIKVVLILIVVDNGLVLDLIRLF